MTSVQPRSVLSDTSQAVGGRHRRRRNDIGTDLDINPAEEEVVSTLVSMRRAIEAMPQESEAQQLDPLINVDVIDDDIVIWPSSREISRAWNQSKAAVSEIIVLDDDVPETTLTLGINGQQSSFNGNKISWDAYKNMENSHIAKKQCIEKKIQGPKKAAYFCRVCWGAIVEETSTKCGHIFCQKCITGYIKENKRCPVCLQKLTLKKIHRVFLPDPDPETDVD